MDADPVSFKDPQYASLDSGVEAKLGLPSGLLSSIRLNGERSNADQVSEAGARTVYQITPGTRKLALDKWGIDPYLNKENAAEVAGLLLKDSLTRNKGNAAMATAEYHGGTDRANWGPRTRAYVQRVTAGLGAPPAADDPGVPADQPVGTSTFDRVSAQMAQPQGSAIANILKAYQSGQMAPDEAKQFEADVKSGRVMLPRGAALTPAAATDAASSAGALPPEVLAAYSDGRMPRAEKIQLEDDVKAGLVKLPAGATLGTTERPGLVDRAKEALTGAERRTAQTEGLEDWAGMPELNSFSMASAKTGLGTLLSNPQETVQIIKANFPGVQVGQDEKGNYILTSSIDGKQYAMKPGFQPSDVARTAGGVAAFTPAGRGVASLGGLAVKSALTQAAIEGTQAATGGEFNPGEVLAAGAIAPVLPAAVNAVRAISAPVRSAVGRVLGTAETGAPAGAAVTPGAPAVTQPGAVVPPAVPAVPPAAAAAPAAMAAPELAQTARAAAEGGVGSGRAMKVLAGQTAPDARTVEAAKRLGIEEYLQPDHVTTNQAYRELAQAVKSVPGSATRSQELEGLSQVGKRADDLINEVGGTTDVSALDASVKSRLQSTQVELEQKANKLYAEMRDAVPAKTGAPARNVLEFVEQRAKDLGGAENLTPMEKQILSKLSPKQAAGGRVQPTYALLDDVRKDLGAAARAAGPFKDADTGLAKKLYSLLSDDQAAVVSRLGMSDTYNAARQAVAVRKGIEDDMSSLFGKQLDGSLVGGLQGAVAALPKGDSSKLVKLLQAVPDDMRQTVVASGLNSAFGKSARNGSLNFNAYANWYEGLLRNKQSYTAVMANLPGPARKQLSDLYRVSRGVSLATKERITTGRIQAVQQELQGADSLMGSVYGLAKRAAVGIPAEAATTAMGLPGAGIASGITSALLKGKPSALKAADALISSPEFLQAAKAAGTPQQAAAARSLAYSKAFTKFVRSVGSPREMSDRERWIVNAMQARNNLDQKRP
jgi:hypothetical protein